MALDFARIKNGSDDTYPKRTFDGQENQSYNFVPAYKVQTGESRGELTIKGIIRVVDSDGTVRLILGYKPEAF